MRLNMLQRKGEYFDGFISKLDKVSESYQSEFASKRVFV